MLASINGLNHQGQHVKELSSFYDNQGKVPIIKLSIWRDTFKTSNRVGQGYKNHRRWPFKDTIVVLNPHLSSLVSWQHFSSFCHIGKVTQARFNTTWNTEGQFCHGSCCSNIDEILTTIGTTNIHLNGLILFDNAGSCHRIAHRDLQGTRIVIGGTGRDKGHLWTIFQTCNPIDHFVNRTISTSSND